MKPYLLVGLSAFALVSLDAAAQCGPGNPIYQLQDLLRGQTVCAKRGSDRWQEEHRPGGELWDYKMGPSDPIDPSKKLGDWSIGGTDNEQITYTYDAFGSSTSYTFEVHAAGPSLYNFCGLGGTQNVLDATIQGASSCP